MRPTGTDGVAWSVRLITFVNPAKTAESIEMPFGVWTRVGPRNRVLDGVQIPSREGAILREKVHVWPLIYLKQLSRLALSISRMPTGVY